MEIYENKKALAMKSIQNAILNNPASSGRMLENDLSLLER